MSLGVNVFFLLFFFFFVKDSKEILKFCTNIEYDLVYCLKENWHPHAYHSLYLSIFLSLQLCPGQWARGMWALLSICYIYMYFINYRQLKQTVSWFSFFQLTWAEGSGWAIVITSCPSIHNFERLRLWNPWAKFLQTQGLKVYQVCSNDDHRLTLLWQGQICIPMSVVSQQFQRTFPLKPLCQFRVNFICSFQAKGERKYIIWSRSHDQGGQHAHIC